MLLKLSFFRVHCIQVLYKCILSANVPKCRKTTFKPIIMWRVNVCFCFALVFFSIFYNIFRYIILGTVFYGAQFENALKVAKHVLGKGLDLIFNLSSLHWPGKLVFCLNSVFSSINLTLCCGRIKGLKIL